MYRTIIGGSRCIVDPPTKILDGAWPPWPPRQRPHAKIGDLPNGCVVCVISPNSVDFGAHCVKVVEDIPTHSAKEM